MFEGAETSAAAAAERRAAAVREEIATRLAEALPRGIDVTVEADGISLSGRALRLRLARDAALARLIAGALA
jgi:hypothetical protein